MNTAGTDRTDLQTSRHQLFDRWWVLPGRIWRALAPPVTVKKNIGGVEFHLSLRDNISYFKSGPDLAAEVERLLEEPFESFWDVGANIGVFSLLAARQGKAVTAFEISEPATKLIQRSPAANGLAVEVQNNAFTVEHVRYRRVASTHTENRVQVCGAEQDGSESITYLDAERKYGRPDLIKMDIEGGELEFLKSKEFRKWIMDNRIIFAVEIHSDAIMEHAWHDVGFRRIDRSHIVFNSRLA